MPVDVDGNTALTAPTCSAGATCATAASAARPLANVTLPSFPSGFLIGDLTSSEVAVTLSPAPFEAITISLATFGERYVALFPFSRAFSGSRLLLIFFSLSMF